MCFVALSESNTFHNAAEKLYISQSSFSYNINNVEKELGLRLVERHARSLSFTEAGVAFLDYAKNIIGEYERMNKILADYKQSWESRFVVFADPLNSYAYNNMLFSFNQFFPDAKAEITQLFDSNINDALSSKKNAVYIVFSTERKPPKGAIGHTLKSDNLAILVSESHCLANQQSIQMATLKEMTLLVISSIKSPFLNEFVTAKCQEAGFAPNIAPYDFWYSSMREPANALGFPAVMPKSAAETFCQSHMRVVSIDSSEFFINVLVSSDCTHSATLQFFEFTKNFIET